MYSFLIKFSSKILVSDVAAGTSTGLRLALRSRVSNDAYFSAYFEDQRRNDSFKYATLPRNFRRKVEKPDYEIDAFSPNTTSEELSDSINEYKVREPNIKLVSGAIANLKVLNTMTLGRKIGSNPIAPHTDQLRGAFARVAAREDLTPPPTPPPTQNNTPVRNSGYDSDSSVYRPSMAAAKSPFFKLKQRSLFKYSSRPKLDYDTQSGFL